jgi:rod shape-determining protein MreC
MRGGRKTNVSALALSPASILQRFSFLFMLAAAAALLILSVVKPEVGEGVRTKVTDAFAPLLSMIAQPVSDITATLATLGSLTELRAENERLLSENVRLRQYQTAVMQLEAENKALRDLLKMSIVPEQRRIVAPVIADAGGPFVRNVIVMAGERQGVRTGLVAVAAGGLAGRIISAGTQSSRLLLISDLNARVPVVFERSRQRGMVAGDNGPELRLTELPPDTEVKVGDRLLTSGVGGIYPPGLPVGVVSRIEGSTIRVEPIADLGRLELVQVLDPGTPADLLSPESTATLPPAMRGANPRR